MPTSRKPPTFADDQLVICVESFSSLDSSCAKGTRLRGRNPAVVARPQFFIDAGASDDEIQAAAEALYPYGRIVR
jgi:hypothetical protein